ncbi:MAG: discoidin domain-containing protein [Lentisphaeria bacterium]|nr:discoidin domain-containing protein [Lentisphaeria bacterium]
MTRHVGLVWLLALLVFATGLVARGASSVFEAEDMIAEGAKTAMVFQGDGLSGGAAVRLGRPSGRKAVPEGEIPALTLTVRKSKYASFVLWGRTLAENGGTDSLWVSVDDDVPQVVSLMHGTGWKWRVLLRCKARNPEVRLRLHPRESGLAVDRLLVTMNPLAIPSGVAGALTTELPALKSPYPPPKSLPPEEHPRVFLRREHLPMLRERAKHPLLAGEYARLKETADRDWDGAFPDSKDFAKGNYHRRFPPIIEANALLYLLEDDEARGKRAVEMLGRALDTVVLSDRNDVTRDYGRMILCAALVYDWCHSLTDPAWRKRVREHMVGLAAPMEIGFPPKRQGAVTGHGGEAQLMLDQLAAAIAVYDEYPDWYLFAAGRFFAEFVPSRNMFFQAHRHHQGDSYGWYRFRWSMYSTFLFDRMGAGPVFDPAQGQVPYSWIYMRRGDGQFLRDGDTFAKGKHWMFPQTAMLTASYYRDPAIHFAFRRMQTFRPNCVPPLWMVLLYDPDVPTHDLAALPLSKYFPSPAGDMVARTGWQLGAWSDAVVAEMKGASYHFNNHDHLDAGAFQIYYKGALATDAGCYGKYGIPYDWHWNKRSISHNTLLVYDPARKQDPMQHDGGQNYANRRREPRVVGDLHKNYRDGKVLAHGFGPDPKVPFYSFLRADLTAGYADRVERVERSGVFLNLGDDSVRAAMVVFDRIVPKEPSHRTVWLVHSVHEPKLEADRFDIRRTDGQCNGRLLGAMLLPEAANRRTEVIGGPGREAEVFGHNFVPARPTLESQGWRLEISPRAPGAEQRFLNVMQVMDAEPEQASLPVERISCPPFIGARIGSAVVLFSEQSELLSGELSVSGGSADSANWVVTGLKPGRWLVRQPNGRIVGTGVVRARETVLCFQAQGLEFTLEPAGGAAGVALSVPSVSVRGTQLTVAVLDGKPISGVPALTVVDGGTRVALAPLARALGYKVEGEGRTLKLWRDGHAREMELGADMLVGIDDLSSLLHCRVRLDPLTGMLELMSPDPAFLWIPAATSSKTEPNRGAERALDENLRSYWAASGDGQWLQLDLGREDGIKCVDVAWLHGDKRKARFDLQISIDGIAWKNVFNGESSGEKKGFESFSFPLAQARFVRLVGHGNSTNAWNSVAEIRVRRQRR